MVTVLLDIADFYAAYYGGSNITDNERYLSRVANEQPEEYERRLARATYPNFQSKIVDTFLSYVFFNKSGVTDSDLDLEEPAREACRHSMIGGMSYLLALPAGIKAYSCLNAKPRKAEGLVIGYDFEGSDGKISIDIPAGLVTIEKKGEETQQLAYLPDMVVPMRWNEKGQSLLRDTAPLNIQVYNLQSVLDSLLLMMLIVYPYGPPVGEEKRPAQGTYIPVNQGEIVPGFAQPNMSQAEILRKEIDVRIMQMGRIVGLESEFSEETTVQSGIARAYQMIDTTAVIGQIAREVANAVNRCAIAWGTMTRGRGGSITINPIIHPEFKADTLREVYSLVKLVKTDKVVKWAQKKAFLSVAANEIEAIKESITDDIEQNGGLNAMDLGYDLMVE